MSDYTQEIEAVQRVMDELDGRIEAAARGSGDWLKLTLWRADLVAARGTIEGVEAKSLGIPFMAAEW